MKKTFCTLFLATALFAACTKKTTNNTTVVAPAGPSYVVDGVTDVLLQNTTIPYKQLALTVEYKDSTQDNVSLSLSALPAGIAIDTTWVVSGIPSFTTTLTFYDTTSIGATPGTYPMTLTATSPAGSKTYNFNIKVKAAPPCTSYIVGKYISSYTSCSFGGYYTDSVYADPTVINKIWFTNFNNSGNSIYGNYNCGTEVITIPSQTVGTHTYSGTGSGYSHYLNISFSDNGSSCTMYME